MANAFKCDKCGEIYAGKAKGVLALPSKTGGDYRVRITPYRPGGNQNVELCVSCQIELTEELLRFWKDISGRTGDD